MDAKKYLLRIRKLDKLIQAKNETLSQLRAEFESAGTASYSADKIQSSGNKDLSDVVARIIDFSNEVDRDVDRLISMKREIVQMIDEVDNADYIDLLYKRYIHFLTWEQISAAMFISERHIYRMHDLALRAFDDVLKKKMS